MLGFRRLGLGVSAIAGASWLGLMSMMNSASAFGADTALIMGPSGFPIPPQSYMDAADDLYLVPNGYGAYTPQVLGTPEGLYPLTGVNTLPLDSSVAQGVTILNDAINQQIAAGNDVVVFGYSQSSTIASQEMAQLAGSSNPPSSNQLSFVLVGDPSNPNGGLLERFDVPGVGALSVPSLGVTFSGATPSDVYRTDIYTSEYDGFADFPQYPIDFLSDLNAYLGIIYQHLTYADLTAQQINSAIALPTVGDTTTHYYMIPTANLPLLDPVRLLPLIGNPLADLLQPDLTVLVNLGYGSITNGWSPGPANVPTPFGLLPTNINPIDVLTALANGAQQGITNALNDLKTPTLLDTSSLSGILAAAHTFGLTTSSSPSLLDLLAALSTFGNGDVPVSSTGGIINTITSAISDDIAVALPIADTALAVAVSLPEYDAKLFVSQLQGGNLLGAIGDPIAADVALAPFALIVGAAAPIVEAAASTVTALAGIVHTPAGTAPTTGGTAPTTGSSTANTNIQVALSTDTGANAGSGANTGSGGAGGAIGGGTGAGGNASAGGAAGSGSTRGSTGQGGAGSAGTTAGTGISTNGASSSGGTSRPGLTGALGAGGTGGGAHTPSTGTADGTAAGGGTGARGTSGSSGSTHSTAGTGTNRAHV
jgi:PE-PPE domain